MIRTTIKIYPNERKRSKVTGKYPLYLRVMHGRKKIEARLDWEITKEELTRWNRKTNRVEFETMTNDFINYIMRRFSQLKFSDDKNIDEMTMQEVRDFIMGIKKDDQKNTTIFQYAESYYKKNVANSTKFKEGTKKNYRKSLNHLKKFISIYKYQSTPIKNLNYSFASDMKSYLINEDPTIDKKGMSEVSAYTVVKSYRTIFNEAVAEELISSNPFLKIKLSNKSPEKPRLSVHQLKELINNKQLKPHELRCLAVFLFMCFTGAAYKDAQELKYSDNIEANKNGVKLTFRRNKTEEESVQYLTKVVIDLIKPFKSSTPEGDYLLPRISNAYFNRILKIIGLKSGINFSITTHTARHTYRQLLDEADIVDPAVICKQMGWSNRNSMDSIYRRVTDSRLLKTKDKFEHFLSNQLEF